MNKLKVVRTPFESAMMAQRNGTLRTPSVMMNGGNIPYFKYQLSVHKFNLGLMSKGIKCKHITLKDLKEYYGLKGRYASQCLEEFMVIFERWTR